MISAKTLLSFIRFRTEFWVYARRLQGRFSFAIGSGLWFGSLRMSINSLDKTNASLFVFEYFEIRSDVISVMGNGFSLRRIREQSRFVAMDWYVAKKLDMVASHVFIVCSQINKCLIVSLLFVQRGQFGEVAFLNLWSVSLTGSLLANSFSRKERSLCRSAFVHLKMELCKVTKLYIARL
ncbi:hypothetical protein O9G_006253 [Rozella allomycis CSF55]|uniref:Uncharacterized protein n=1 Tax=Rozella allomycis (strain CSF55) TaxID=988480 RepID=A0A075AZ73_ROZAC|nr:hypothetical protein O9G_006253 [Rozella allomycis CSF55]|eukprot:EPZ35439.1 hypothetical protein O9G_006253 [Rozella allomycis CSF55]